MPSRRAYCRANSLRGETDPAVRSYPPVEAVRRALNLLKAINELGIVSVGDLHRVTGIAKPTVVRMLETLMTEGYVARDNFFGGYRVTSHVQSLSSGFHGAPLIVEAARAWAVRLTQAILWPVGIGILEGDQISVKFTTAAISPWPHPVSSLNMRLDLTTSAMGRCYLAFCKDGERDVLLKNTRVNGGASDDKSAYINALIRTVQRDGFALRDGRVGPKSMQVIALPIINEGTVVACLGMGFYTSAVPSSRIFETFVKPMRDTVMNIEKDIVNLRSLIRAPV
jgi:IclR family mhp operon transcriptional activator